MDWLKFLEKGKISFSLLLTISALSGCLVFLPVHIKEILSINLFATKFKEYIGPAFFVSTILLILNVILMISNSVSKSIRIRKYKRQIVENVNSLSHVEKSILREFYLNASDALALPLQNASVAGLVNKGILYQVGSYGGMTHRESCFNYSITSTAKKHITPASINLPLDLNEETKQQLIANRPEWMRDNWY